MRMFKKKKGLRNPAKHKAKVLAYADKGKTNAYGLLCCYPNILGIVFAIVTVLYFHLFNQKFNGSKIGHLNYLHAYLVAILALVQCGNKFNRMRSHCEKVVRIRVGKQLL